LAIHLSKADSVPWYAVTSWTEKPESDFYCLEPWLGLPNAIHHGQGLRRIPPGETEKGVCRIELGVW
jgi:galactose mutarotase-like enzyme